jgi:hypothetical protein
VGAQAHARRRRSQGEGQRAGKCIDTVTDTKGKTAMSDVQSDVKVLEETVRLEPLEDAPLNALIDALIESGKQPQTARRRANDTRGDGLGDLLATGTRQGQAPPCRQPAQRRLVRSARRELRRAVGLSAQSHLPFAVIRGWSRPKRVGSWGQHTFSAPPNGDERYVGDRIEMGALYLLKLLRRLAK